MSTPRATMTPLQRELAVQQVEIMTGLHLQQVESYREVGNMAKVDAELALLKAKHDATAIMLMLTFSKEQAEAVMSEGITKATWPTKAA